jgi:hypothetical protein
MHLKTKLAVAAGVLTLGGAGFGSALIASAPAAVPAPAVHAASAVPLVRVSPALAHAASTIKTLGAPAAAATARPAAARPAAASSSRVAQTSSNAETATAENENAPESEAGQPGEPQVGHQDAPGNVSHDCTGNCVE